MIRDNVGSLCEKACCPAAPSRCRRSLGEALRQQFIVENMPGGSGNAGAAAAARAAPDGYTFMVAADPALTVNQSLYKELPYNAERDFVPVARGVTVPLVICVPGSLGVRTLAE